MKTWHRMAAVLILTVVGVRGLDLAIREAPLPAPAARFFTYYEALEDAGVANLFDRVLYSLMLAGDRA